MKGLLTKTRVIYLYYSYNLFDGLSEYKIISLKSNSNLFTHLDR